METNELLMLIGVIVIAIMVLRFLWNMVGSVLKLAVAVIVIGAGVYFIKPELLYNVFGKDKVEAVATDAKVLAKEGYDAASDAVSDVASDAVTEVKETAKENIDTVIVTLKE